jgi:dimeric dUTPase (all-alpha-NTP-PPase superfamily)
MFNIKKLLGIQKEFGDSIAYKPTMLQYILALNVEIAELLNLLPWKWWKSTYEMDKAKILEELADVLAFWFSYYNLFFANHHVTALLPTEEVVEREKDQLEHSIIYGIERELKNSEEPNVFHIHFEDQYSMIQMETAGRRMGKLIGIVMRITGASLEDVTVAYTEKMIVNWSRQKNKY